MKPLPLLILLLATFTTQAQITANELRQSADTIRYEKAAGKNTAERIGRMFNRVIDYTDTMAVQRLDSLLTAGIAGLDEVWKTSGSTNVSLPTIVGKTTFTGRTLPSYGKIYVDDREANLFYETVSGQQSGVDVSNSGTIVSHQENATGIVKSLAITPSNITLSDGDGIGIQYAADYSSGFTARSLIDKGYADTHYSYTAGNGLSLNGNEFSLSNIITAPSSNLFQISGSSTAISLGAGATSFGLSDYATLPLADGGIGFQMATDVFDNVTFGSYQAGLFGTTNLQSFDTDLRLGYWDYGSSVWGPLPSIRLHTPGDGSFGTTLYIDNLPTTSPCATAGSNAIWNDAGTLKICP